MNKEQEFEQFSNAMKINANAWFEQGIEQGIKQTEQKFEKIIEECDVNSNIEDFRLELLRLLKGEKC